MRRRVSNDRPSKTTPTTHSSFIPPFPIVCTAVFGQPLTAVIDNQRFNKGGLCSPTTPYPPAGSLSTYQNHPVSSHGVAMAMCNNPFTTQDQPVAVRDEDQVDTPLSSSLGYLEGDAPDAKPSSPISPCHDSLPQSHDQQQVPLIVQKAIHYLDQNGMCVYIVHVYCVCVYNVYYIHVVCIYSILCVCILCFSDYLVLHLLI